MLYDHNHPKACVDHDLLLRTLNKGAFVQVGFGVIERCWPSVTCEKCVLVVLPLLWSYEPSGEGENLLCCWTRAVGVVLTKLWSARIVLLRKIWVKVRGCC